MRRPPVYDVFERRLAKQKIHYIHDLCSWSSAAANFGKRLASSWRLTCENVKRHWNDSNPQVETSWWQPLDLYPSLNTRNEPCEMNISHYQAGKLDHGIWNTIKPHKVSDMGMSLIVNSLSWRRTGELTRLPASNVANFHLMRKTPVFQRSYFNKRPN